MTITCNTEICMEDIGLIPRPVCDAAVFKILQVTVINIKAGYHLSITYLCRENECRQLLGVDPWYLVQNRHCGKNPEAVANLAQLVSTRTLHARQKAAYIFEFLWPTIQAAVGKLPLGKPPPKRVLVDLVQPIQNGKGCNTHEHWRDRLR